MFAPMPVPVPVPTPSPMEHLRALGFAFLAGALVGAVLVAVAQEPTS